MQQIMPGYGYVELSRRIYPMILKSVFSDPMACLYDRPLGVKLGIYSFATKQDIPKIGFANVEFAGNMINLRIPNIITFYDNQSPFDQQAQTDQIATDIVASLIHEAFHINQDIDLYLMNSDAAYRERIENANMAASDKWLLDHIMQINRLVVQNHPWYYGLNLSRIIFEYNSKACFLDQYHLKDMEQTIGQKIKLFLPDQFWKFMNAADVQIVFRDEHVITLKQNGVYDCNPVINSLGDLNRLLYAMSHGLTQINYHIDGNETINCIFDTEWETVRLYSLNEFEF